MCILITWLLNIRRETVWDNFDQSINKKKILFSKMFSINLVKWKASSNMLSIINVITDVFHVIKPKLYLNV